jgi:hypothetical protein
MIIANGLYNRENDPKGPERHKSIVIHSPATTGGSPIPILINMRTNRLPGKDISPSITPAGMPMNVLTKTAVKDTFKVSQVISKISGSPEISISIAFFNPSIKRSIIIPAFYQAPIPSGQN